MPSTLALDETDPHMKWEQVQETQRYRLRRLIKRIYRNSPFYSKLMRENSIDPDSIKTLEDLHRMPFTTKEDMRVNSYPYGGEFLAVPVQRIAGWHMTSGSTGTPTVGAYTARDVRTWSKLMARSLTAAGVKRHDVLANGYGYGLFTGGMGFHLGALAKHVSIIPWGSGRSEAMVRAIRDFRATVLSGTPSYQLLLAEMMNKLGIDVETDIALRISMPGAEMMTLSMLERIEKGFCLKSRGGGARVIYGLTEALGPGVAQSCASDRDGSMHIWTDHFLAEIVQPDSDEVLGEGEEGELVITTLTKEAMPLVRYRTRDLTAIEQSTDDIPFPRIAMIKGRLDDAIFYKGAKIFPSAINSILLSIPEVNEYRLVVDKRGTVHSIVLQIETDEPSERLRERVSSLVTSACFVRPDVEFVPRGSLPRFEGKGKRETVLE